MARNDEGEFELILGNRQLVSVFLIVVILLGAFFSMGYLVGRSSSPVVSADAGTRGDGGSKPIVVDSARIPPQPPPETAPSSAEPAAAAQAKPSPVREEPKREPAPKPRTEAPVTLSEAPRAGQTFLQVVATTRPDAEIVAESLAKKGFRTTIAPGPSAGIFRVLVGPVPNGAELAEMRVRLEATGFKPYVRRY